MYALHEMSQIFGAERTVSAGQPGRIAHLTDLLRRTFCVTEHVLGRDRFGELARAYLAGRPAPANRASSHSMGFPAFLGQTAEAADRPYLIDLARLELAVRRARHSPIRAGQDLEQLRWRACGRSDFLLDLQLSIQLVLVRWSVLDLWQRHTGGHRCGHETPCRQTRRLQILNPGGEIAIRDLTHATFSLRHGLLTGYTLEHAVQRALRRDPFFDLVSELLALFDEGLVVGIRRISSSPPNVNS
jgi:uncharacterized protein